MRMDRLVSCGVLAAALFVSVAPPARAGGNVTYEDKQRGFRLRIGDKYEQVPPKLTADESFIVGDWYADSAKFDGGFQRPEFKVFWFATPKASTITPGSKDPPPGADATKPESPEDMMKKFREERRSHSVDEAIDDYFSRVGPYFGGSVPTAADLWKSAKKTGTKTPGVDALWTEINDPDDKKGGKKKHHGPDQGGPPDAYALVAKLTLDRPGESIEVGFMGYCGYDFVKDGKKNFLDIVKSFEDLAKIATDSRNLGAQSELDENDPEKFRAIIKKSKLIKGWTCYDTPHYVVLYPDKDVDPNLAKMIGTQIEALRTQVYEVMFPPDRPIKAISVIRCCADAKQYFAYGGPGGSAGYWASGEKELVFYEMDRSKGGDSLRVLYHEGFHQYIYYSVGDFAPHSWFNEGDGDYFFGFNYSNGKWTRGVNSWRRDESARAKREHKFPPLWDWLHWSQHEYYGGNKAGVPIGDNYALGWDFVYFMRTTKKKEYQGVLDKYFNVLKGLVTKGRKAREDAMKPPPTPPVKPGDGAPPAGGDGQPPAGGDGQPPSGGDGKPPAGGDGQPPAGGDGQPPVPATPPVPPPDFSEMFDSQKWLDQALEEAFKGIDLKQLEKDWLDFKP